MNTSLLLKIKERILLTPEHFEINAYFGTNECGTTACIAGWALAIDFRSKRRRLKYTKALDELMVQRGGYNMDYFEDACKLLGLTHEQGQRLFYLVVGSAGYCWPSRFSTDYIAAQEDRDHLTMAQVAAERIDHFITTEGQE